MIALDAFAVLPPPMREAVTPHVSMLLAGVVEPDFNKRFATDAEEILRLGRDLDDVSFVLGQATHFVQDLNQPLHVAWGETRAEHNEVEAQL